MKIAQLKGYYLEEIVKYLLKTTKYIDIKEGNVPGRGANHQIDSYGIFSFTIPFVYPVRLLSEAKWYNTKIGLSRLRDFVGVIKDISENYFVPIDSEGNRNISDSLKDRYTDCGAFFSVTDFTIPAQNYAYAHGIYLITFKMNSILSPVIERAEELLVKLNLNNAPSINLNRKQVSELFNIHVEHDRKFHKILSQINTYLGVLDGVYPIIITSKRPFNFRNEFADDLSTVSFEIPDSAYKEYRLESSETVLFRFHYQNNIFEFTLPTSTSKNLIRAIENTYSNQPFSKIEIPIELSENGRKFRRVFSLKLSLPDSKHAVEKLEKTWKV